MSTRLRVYISGPITKGDRIRNFAQAATAQQELMSLGFAPFNPMLSILHPNETSIPHEQWLESDLPWVQISDAILRLPGESIGADAECEHARGYCVPVFYTLDSLVAWADNKKSRHDHP